MILTIILTLPDLVIPGVIFTVSILGISTQNVLDAFCELFKDSFVDVPRLNGKIDTNS